MTSTIKNIAISTAFWVAAVNYILWDQGMSMSDIEPFLWSFVKFYLLLLAAVLIAGEIVTRLFDATEGNP